MEKNKFDISYIKENEEDILCYNPFDGDFGSPGDRILKDRLVVANKEHVCFLCKKEIKKGSINRVRADISDGEFMHFRWCQECCGAMAMSWTDNGKSLEDRYKKAVDNYNS